MGKNAKLRKKRSQRRITSSFLFRPTDDEFRTATDKLATHLLCHHPVDVYLAIAISDLWPENIASNAKHTFALQVLLSLNPSDFHLDQKLDNYSAFAKFLTRLYELVPSFPQLDDFTPQTDWGEVKIRWQHAFYHYFYGCSVHRVPDHVTAFEIIHRSHSAAINDIRRTLQIQDYIISSIQPVHQDRLEDIRPGQTKIPNQVFWEQSRAALSNTFANVERPLEASPGLVTSLGATLLPTSWDNFGDSVLRGTALPFTWIHLDSHHYPFKPREALGAVIDYWTSRTSGMVSAPDGGASAQIADYVQARFPLSQYLPGPLKISVGGRRVLYTFAGMFIGPKRLHLILPLRHELLQRLPDIRRSLSTLPTTDQPWRVDFERGSGLSIGHSDAIELLVVIPTPAIQIEAPLPRGSWHVLPLPDLVTILDSISDSAELERFLAFIGEQSTPAVSIGSSLANHFAAFREAQETLIPGANSPTMLQLDPHWESSWRFEELKKWWLNFPPDAPFLDRMEWKPVEGDTRPHQLIGRSRPSASWWLTIGDCTLHFVVHLTHADIQSGRGEMLGLLAHCIADSIDQRQRIVSAHPAFSRKMIVTECSIRLTIPDSTDSMNRPFSLAGGNANENTIYILLDADLEQVRRQLENPTDARFEASCAADWIGVLTKILGLPDAPEIEIDLQRTSNWRPRFRASSEPWNIDAPTSARPLLPSPADYKRARKKLAITLASLEFAPGEYDLDEAKTIVDLARDKYRDLVHQKIMHLDRPSLLRACIEQHEALIIHQEIESGRLQASLLHEVEYDRLQAQSELTIEFTKSSKNYRYILEHCLSSDESGVNAPSEGELLEIVALVDWLLVLYSISDVLHNAIDAAGIRIDDDFVPTVFHGPEHHALEAQYGRKDAAVQLGISVRPKDAVQSGLDGAEMLSHVDPSFVKDAGFRLTDLLALVIVLSQWNSVRGEAGRQLIFQATAEEIAAVLQEHGRIPGAEIAKRVVDFATLNPLRVRKLLDREQMEADVPIWEHLKREHRYPIRPLVPVGQSLMWAAATAQRSGSIWVNSISDGYLPVDYKWPNVQGRIREIKERIEKQLEVRALEIVQRHCSHAIGNLDFRSRFPRRRFDDAGDFDVLAYWSSHNTWLIVECKYNSPAFCAKDSRRLRDRIFGTPGKKGQLEKMDRRRRFLEEHLPLLRELLGWPAPPSDAAQAIREVYVCRRVDWWLEAATQNASRSFLRVDQLDEWLGSTSFASIQADDSAR